MELLQPRSGEASPSQASRLAGMLASFGGAVARVLALSPSDADGAPTRFAPPGDTQSRRAPDPDKRCVERQHVLLSGKIVFDQGARSIDCEIRDLSVTGARVRLAKPEPLPSSVYLLDLQRGLAFEARRVWSRGEDLGLHFSQIHALQDARSPVMKAMRAIWLQHLAR